MPLISLRSHRASIALAAILLSTLAACGGLATVDAPKSVVDGGTQPAQDGGSPRADGSAPSRVPTDHRPTATTCTGDRPPGISAADSAHFSGDCRSDADCTAGKNGRCELEALSKLVCTYDECAADSDCSAGVCTCRNDAHFGANTCFHGDCTTDADCGSSYCSPSGTTIQSNCMTTATGPVPASAFGYFCHSPADECVDDSDCGPDAHFSDVCAFQSETRKWVCLKLRCSG